MKKPWQQFEKDAHQYLTDKYQLDGVSFCLQGASNSNLSDIKVTNSKTEFFMEAKQAKAQSGQFVLLMDKENKQFVFSPKNKSQNNTFTKSIIANINKNIDVFKDAGTAGMSIDIDKSIFYSWIEDNYKNKGVSYFITENNGEYIIFPIDKFKDYFDVVATSRIKGSGSSKVSVRDRGQIRQFLGTYTNIENIYLSEKGAMMVEGCDLNNEKFTFENFNYQFSKRGENLFEVRKLSNTKNMTVIFSVLLKNTQREEDLISFEKILKN